MGPQFGRSTQELICRLGPVLASRPPMDAEVDNAAVNFSKKIFFIFGALLGAKTSYADPGDMTVPERLAV